MMIGDVIEVRDREGGQYEGVLRWHFGGRMWRFEWIAGPHDGDSEIVTLDDDE